MAFSLLSHAGVSRSASVVIAYVMKKLDLGYKDAYKFVKERRKVIHPNPGFVGQLIKWDEARRKKDEPIIEND